MAGNITIIEPRENFQKVAKDVILNKEIDVLTLGVYVRVLCLGKKWEEMETECQRPRIYVRDICG